MRLALEHPGDWPVMGRGSILGLLILLLLVAGALSLYHRWKR